MRSLAIAPLLALAVVGLVACGGGKSSNNANNAANSAGNAAGNAGYNSAASAKIPNCGAVKAVWVNLNTKAYHEPGDQYYGNTKNGEYLCPSQAKAQGFHASGGAMMVNQSNQMNSGHHRRHHNVSSDTSTP